jgi:hypothetical protein
VVAALILLVVAYNALASSSLFELRRVDTSGVSPDLRADVEQVVRRAVSESRLLSIDLAAIKRKVEELPQVREASVARMLPDGLYVSTLERQPAVLVRRQSQSLVWLDAESHEVGEFSEVKHGSDVPPILKGFIEGVRSPAAVHDDQERIALYRRIEREMKEADKPLWDLIDEIDLSFPVSVNLRLTSPLVTVVVGNKDFRNRFETALKVLEAAMQGDSGLLSRFGVRDPEQMIQNRDRIAFMDTSRPDRIVYSFSTPGRERVQEEATRRTGDAAAPKPPSKAPSTGTTKAGPAKKN